MSPGRAGSLRSSLFPSWEVARLVVVPDAQELVRLDRSRKALHLQLRHRLGLDPRLDGRVRALAQEYLTSFRLVAQPGGHVRDSAERAVVVAPFESNPAERRVPYGNPGAEAELVPALAPIAGELSDPLPHCDREPRGTEFVLGHRHRIVDRKSTRLNSSHITISYAVFCLKKKK